MAYFRSPNINNFLLLQTCECEFKFAEWWDVGVVIWVKVQTCIWPSRCHCHSLSLAPVNPDWFFTRDSIYAIVHICHGNSVCLSVCLSVSPRAGASKEGGVGQKSDFSTFVQQYLENGARYDQSCY